MARLEGLQKTLANRSDRGLIKLKAKIRRELDMILDREELLWYQKSRVDSVEWLRDGDRNTTFFHLSTIVRRWKNKIIALKGDGEWINDNEGVKNQIVRYFSTLFTDEGDMEVHNIPKTCSMNCREGIGIISPNLTLN